MIWRPAHHVNGASVPGTGPTLIRRNPSDDRDVVAEFEAATAAEVDQAVSAAHRAAPAWRGLTGPARAGMLFAWGDAIATRAEDLAQLIAREVGKPIGEARGEVTRAVAICRYYAGEAVRDVGEVIPAATPETTQWTRRDPLGAVALITPWNFPMAIPVWKAAPALAFGNTVVLKPSELSSAVGHLLAETTRAAGFPAGVVNVVMGDGETGRALVMHADIRGVSFTGSGAVGQAIQLAAAGRNVRCQAEMGGKNVVVVMPDADLERAAELTAAGAFRFAGQKCTATSRVVVHRDVSEAFERALAAAAARLTVGPVADPATAIGPLVSAAARDRVRRALAATTATITSHAVLPTDEPWGHGQWVAPVTCRVADQADPIARDELFAPVIALLEADDLDHALALANDTPYGLSASLFTRDLSRAFHYIREIDVGLVRVNGDTTGVDLHAPFGGVKASSSGSREQGRAAREFFTDIRTIQIHA